MANFADLTSQGVERYNSAALENAALITTVQSLLFGFAGRNTDASNAIYIMVFDLAAAPVSSTSIPVITIGVPPAGTGVTAANGNFFYQAPLYGIKFKLGIQIAASSTDALTYTAVATSKTSFDVYFARETGVDAL